MRTPPAHDVNGGADERLPARRPATAPAPAGEALVERLVDRLAHVERDLRATHASASSAEARLALLGDAARLLADHDGVSVADVVRLALPLLGDWCVVETIIADCADRRVVALDEAVERAAAALEGPFRRGDSDLADDALADGPVLRVPVHAQGRLVGTLAFGRDPARDEYGPWERRLAADLAAFAAIAVEQRRARLAADESARTKAEFLTMMSHELRTPLNAIAGYAQLLEMGFRGPLNDGQAEAVGRILRGQEHLLELVDGVLTFSRLTSGRLALDVMDVDAATLLAVAADSLRADFAARGIRLVVSACRREVRVLADRERAPQILRLLLSNALKFTEPGGEVSVACEPDEHVARFLVSDTGRGIPPAQREAIFQPFVQGEKGHTRTVDGSGLGLAIARELAIRMGGTLSVTSEVGVGSRFALTLPRTEAPSRASAGTLN